MTDINKPESLSAQEGNVAGFEETKKDLAKNLDIPHERFVDTETIELKDNEFLVEDRTAPEIMEWMIKNESKLPIEMMIKALKANKTISLELHRRPKQTGKWWIVAVGPALAYEHVKLGEVLSTDKDELQGNIILYLTFEPIEVKPLTARVSAKLVEYPEQSKWDMINKGLVFTKTLDGEEFEQEKKI